MKDLLDPPGTYNATVWGSYPHQIIQSCYACAAFHSCSDHGTCTCRVFPSLYRDDDVEK